jgi:hypothetical protein
LGERARRQAKIDADLGIEPEPDVGTPKDVDTSPTPTRERPPSTQEKDEWLSSVMVALTGSQRLLGGPVWLKSHDRVTLANAGHTWLRRMGIRSTPALRLTEWDTLRGRGS